MKKRSFADGGVPNNAPIVRPGFSRSPTGRVELTPQQETLADKNKAAFEALMAAKSQYGPGLAGAKSPERLHYESYLAAERRRMNELSAMGPFRGSAVSAYTPLKYDPMATYRGYSLPPGAKKGGAVKVKKMAEGGSAVLRGEGSGNVQQRFNEHPDAAKIRANALAFEPLGLARRQYGAGTPDYDNYRAFYDMEQAKFRDAMGGGSLFPRKDVSVGTYTAGTYNPATNYGAIAQQQDAAALAAKKAAKERFEAARKPATKMAKGGVTSSASKRGDGCAMRGKTKCKMR